MANEENIKKLLSDNKITKKKNLRLKYEFPHGFHIPENNGCSILCRVVLGTIIKSLDYSGSLIGISISSRKPFETTTKRKSNNKKKVGVGPPPMTEMKNTDGEIIRLVQVNCSLSTPIEYSLFRQYLNESLQFSIKDWCAEFENIYNEINEIDTLCIPKLMICTTSPGDDICNQWIEFIQSIVPPLFDNDDNKFILHHWDDKCATICIMDQLIRVYNEEEEEEEEESDDEDNEEEKEKILVQDLNIGHYVQSIMDHTANIFNFIHGKTSTIYKNVNADSTIIIDCDLNQNIGKILQFMKDKYLDPNPQTPCIQLYYTSTNTNTNSGDKHGARYVQFSNLPSLEFVTNSSIRSYKNAYFVSHDNHQQNIVHYVLTKNNRAYIVNNEKLGVLIWYFIRCLANHTSISNTIHIFLSVGRDSSSDYLDFLDITKIEIYSHDKKSYNDVVDEYADECIICIEYKQSGNSIIVFSQNIVEKLQYISDKNDSFTPEDALLDFYRLFESGNNDSIINFLIAQLSLQLFHIGISEWIDIYDIDLLSLYQHSITVKKQTKQKQQNQMDSPLSDNEDEDEDDDEDDESDDEYESESESESASEQEEENDSSDISISDPGSMDEDDVDELLDLPAENEEEQQEAHQPSNQPSNQPEPEPDTQQKTTQTDEKMEETDEIQKNKDEKTVETEAKTPEIEPKTVETDEKTVETVKEADEIQSEKTKETVKETSEAATSEEPQKKQEETEEREALIEAKQQTETQQPKQKEEQKTEEMEATQIENKPKEKVESKHKLAIPVPSLNQSQSTDADPDIGHILKHGHITETSVDIDSYANKMSANDRTQILNNKKKKLNKRMGSVTLQKLQKDLILNGGSPTTTPPDVSISLIGGTPLQERALLSYQNSMKNQRRWNMEDAWLSKQRAKQSRGIPLKSQKSLQLLQRMEKFNENQKMFDDEKKWRAKLEERNKKNTYKKSPTSSTDNINKQSIIKPEKPEKPEKISTKMTSETKTKTKTSTKQSTPKTLSSPTPKNHRRHTSASQQAIIKKLTKSADEWKTKYKNNDGDDTLQHLRKKNMSSKVERQKKAAEHQNKMELKNVSWNNKNNNNHNSNSNSNSNSSHKKINKNKKNINNLIYAHIDRFIAAKDINNTLLKGLNDENYDLILLGLQTKKIDNKNNNERLNKIEVIFEERLNIYQRELLNIQNGFELEISNNINDEKDEKNEKNDEEISVDDHRVIDDGINIEKEDTNEENSFKILRDLNILINNDTILNMNNLDIINNKNGDIIRNFIKNCIINNGRLVSIQFINTKGLDDKWFINDILHAISCNAKLLTQLLLNNNALLTSKSIKELAKYVQSNPPCLRVLKFNNVSNEINYNVISTFLKALNKNTQIIKVIMDTQTNQQQSKLQKILNRNWKRYVKERRLKKTLLTQIQNRKIDKHDKKNTKNKNAKKKKIK